MNNSGKKCCISVYLIHFSLTFNNNYISIKFYQKGLKMMLYISSPVMSPCLSNGTWLGSSFRKCPMRRCVIMQPWSWKRVNVSRAIPVYPGIRRIQSNGNLSRQSWRLSLLEIISNWEVGKKFHNALSSNSNQYPDSSTTFKTQDQQHGTRHQLRNPQI